jgi:hypothetical protein
VSSREQQAIAETIDYSLCSQGLSDKAIKMEDNGWTMSSGPSLLLLFYATTNSHPAIIVVKTSVTTVRPLYDIFRRKKDGAAATTARHLKTSRSVY